MATANGVLVISGAVASAAAFSLLVPFILESMDSLKRMARLQRRVRSETIDMQTFSLFARLAQRVSFPTLSLFQVLSEQALTGRPARYLSQICEQDGVSCSKAQAAGMLVVFEATVLLGALAITRSIPLSIGLCAVCLLCIIFDARKGEGKRTSLMREQLPDALQSLKTSLGAGRSLPQSLSYAAASIPAPLGRELQQAAWDIEAGSDIAGALDALKRRTTIEELSFVSMALVIQHKTGGSLKPIFEAAQAAVRSSFELERSLKVQTAQGRLSARIVGVMPLCLVALLALVSPGYLDGFFGSAVGIVVFLTALVLDGIGLLLIRRILDVGGLS